MDKKGFTILEIVVVMIVITILLSLSFSAYNKTLETSRISEAKAVLGQIRRAQIVYYQDYGNYTMSPANLMLSNITLMPCPNQNTSYFRYSLPDRFMAKASRCTTGGKPPADTTNYSITLSYDNGTWGYSVGGSD